MKTLLIAFLAIQAHAAQPTAVAKLRLDLDGDGKPDLVRIVDRGSAHDEVEIFYTSGKAAETFPKLLRGTRKNHDVWPPTLEKSAGGVFVIKEQFAAERGYSVSNDTTVGVIQGELHVLRSEHSADRGGGETSEGSEDVYDFVNHVVSSESWDASGAGDMDPLNKNFKLPLPASCQPTLREWDPANKPPCAMLP